MKSHKKTPAIRLVLGLISPKRCEDLLLDWVNLRNEDAAACLQLLKRYRDVFEGLLPVTSTALLSYRDLLRKAWKATPDARRRDWYLFQLRMLFQYQVNARRMGLDPDQLSEEAMRGNEQAGKQLKLLTEPALIDTPIEAALFYLQTRAASRIRICPNLDCPARYFLKSTSNPKQTSCSPECADWVRRDSKRRWWTENRGASADEIYKGERKKGSA